MLWVGDDPHRTAYHARAATNSLTRFTAALLYVDTRAEGMTLIDDPTCLEAVCRWCKCVKACIFSLAHGDQSTEIGSGGCASDKPQCLLDLQVEDIVRFLQQAKGIKSVA